MIVDVLRLFERWKLEQVVVREGKNGDEAWACCPFHNERRPSFSVNITTGKWHCFGCHERGTDITSLVSKIEQLESPGEIQHFLQTAAVKQADEIRDDLRKILAMRKEQRANRGKPDRVRTEEWRFYAHLEHSYLEKRGFNNKIVRVHRIGYDAGARAITIPVFEHGICRFVYRRAVTKNARPKYLYPTEINKSNYLWGLDKPASEYQNQTIYVVEGALDALWLRQHGYLAVAILGSFISEVQVRKLLALDPKEIVLFFDNDEAGYDATEHAGKTLLRQGMRKVYYLRYRADSGDDPQSCSATTIHKMIKRRKHIDHFLLHNKIGRRKRIRNLLAMANNNH